MRATFKVLFYVNRSKEKGGTTRLSVSGRVPRNCPHHGTSNDQRNNCTVQLQAQYPKGTLGYQGEPCRRQEQGGAGNQLRVGRHQGADH